MKKFGPAYIAVALLFSILIAGYRLSNLLWNPIGDEVLVAFAWFKPFVYRMLIPFTVKYFLYVFHVQPAHMFIVLECLGLFLSVIFYAKYLNLFIPNAAVSKILSFTLFFLIPFEMLLSRYNAQWFPYDVWTLFFTITLLFLLYTEKYGWYLLVFIVGTLNKETTLVVTGIACILYLNQKRNRRFLGFIVLQVIVWLVMKVALGWLFSDREGALFFEQYVSNWRYLSDPTYLRQFKTTWFEMIFRYVVIIGNFGFLWLFVVRYRKLLRDAFLRLSLWIIVPFIALMLYAGNIFELRIYTEIIPIILTPALVIVVRLLEGKSGAYPDPAG